MLNGEQRKMLQAKPLHVHEWEAEIVQQVPLKPNYLHLPRYGSKEGAALMLAHDRVQVARVFGPIFFTASAVCCLGASLVFLASSVTYLMKPPPPVYLSTISGKSYLVKTRRQPAPGTQVLSKDAKKNEPLAALAFPRDAYLNIAQWGELPDMPELKVPFDASHSDLVSKRVLGLGVALPVVDAWLAERRMPSQKTQISQPSVNSANPASAPLDVGVAPSLPPSASAKS